MSEPLSPVPLVVRLELARAAVQTIAQHSGARVLHIKGTTWDPSLRAAPAHGSDVDVIVEPAGIPAVDRALRAHGWKVYSTFRNGSPFEHAQTYWHPDWGYTDVHRWFPGIRMPAERAFALLAAGGGTVDAAGVACPVPGADAQAVLLMLNAARGSDSERAEANSIWDSADAGIRRRRDGLVDALDARTGWAAARGTLDDYRGRADHALWRVTLHGGSRIEEWWARVRAQPTLLGAAGTALRAPLVNTDRLAHELGRRPGPADIVRAFGSRASRGVREIVGGKGRR
ncbi:MULTISPECIES: hypothetical protein [unclassified Microbacterium]|uniref:hypothetical protein n=1 Tax=unclassified Microbacterium TaxID=2609290 RepID=UPI0012FB737D|nr:hypothetical protein [Microbacterium sp. MAH-37]MVQ42623.1 hypothetical protein [Microbacterium sp. MAH-37]